MEPAPTRDSTTHGPRGFTLLEILIVLVVVALLAAFALPGYRGQALRAHRVEAQAALLDLAAAQERHHLRHLRYATDALLTSAPPDGLGLPRYTRNGRYSIDIAAGADASDFTATATAVGEQATDTGCTRFSIDARGVRTATGTGGPSGTCWP
jgi:type IV pilus assembly protein PilE